MPTSEQILDGLRRIANDWRGLAVVWHVYFGVVALYLVWGAPVKTRRAGVLLALPLLSVSMLAWITGNPFNGLIFGLCGTALLAVAVCLGQGAVGRGPCWVMVSGALLFIFGWVYPHFLDSASPWSYAVAAPLGLIPCPTLSAVIGLTLVFGGLGSRAWSLLLGVTGLFYGAFGAAYLGVALDWVLLAGATLMLLIGFAKGRQEG